MITKAKFRKTASTIISSVEQAFRLEGSKRVIFEADSDYESGRIGNFYSTISRIDMCVQVFVRHDNPNYVMVTLMVPFPDNFIQLYPELNDANDEFCGAKVVYNEEENAIAIVCEIDTRNFPNGEYARPIINGVITVLDCMALALENNLLEGVTIMARNV